MMCALLNLLSKVIYAKHISHVLPSMAAGLIRDVEFDYKPVIAKALSDGEATDIFDRLVLAIEDYYFRPVSTISGIKKKGRRSTTRKGCGWEVFCRDWLLVTKRFDVVYLLKDCPVELRESLKLPSGDIGIDIIAGKNVPAPKEEGVSTLPSTSWSAIQAKYREPIHTTYLYADLATFNSTCRDSGPWVFEIVMTNCKGLSRKKGLGPRPSGARSVCYKSFKNTSRAVWESLCGYQPGHVLGTSFEPIILPTIPEIIVPVKTSLKELSLEDLRKKRLIALGCPS